MRFQESSPVLSTPDQDIITITKAAAGKSGQEKENEFYFLLKTCISLGGAVEEFGLARMSMWKFKVDLFQLMMVPDGVYVVFQSPTKRMFGLKRELK